MKNVLCFALMLLAMSACRQETPTEPVKNPTDFSLQALTEERPEWQYEQLRLIPILASDEFIQENKVVKNLKTLAEAIENPRFRISEKKPFGRFDDTDAVNGLTVQNKTQDPIFLMGGDIVQGGRQDRVLGEDQVIAARSIKNIPVFCVEPGRWSYTGAPDEEARNRPQSDQIYAFSGYYHVAASDIRQTLKSSKSQQEVWNKVGALTAHHKAESPTGAYASLEDSEAFTQTRDGYLKFFSDKFTGQKNMVGIMAASGDEIIAVDVFGHPDLLQRQFNHLLHSYATDAMTKGSPLQLDAGKMEKRVKEINVAVAQKKATRYQDALVHYYE